MPNQPSRPRAVPATRAEARPDRDTLLSRLLQPTEKRPTAKRRPGGLAFGDLGSIGALARKSRPDGSR